jgi:hypothetical protein
VDGNIRDDETTSYVSALVSAYSGLSTGLVYRCAAEEAIVSDSRSADHDLRVCCCHLVCLPVGRSDDCSHPQQRISTTALYGTFGQGRVVAHLGSTEMRPPFGK